MKRRITYCLKLFANLPLLQVAVGLVMSIINFELNIFTLELMFIVSLFLFVNFVLFRLPLSPILIVATFFYLGSVRVDGLYGQLRTTTVATLYGKQVNSLQTISVPEYRNGRIQVVARSDNVKGKILLNLPLNLKLRCRQELRGQFLLEEPPKVDGFNYQRYLQTQGVWFVSRADSIIIQEQEKSVASYMCNSKIYFTQRLNQAIPLNHTMLIAGLLWGQRANLPEDFESNLSRTGTTHIIAVSGFNVSIIVLMLLGLAGILPRRWVTLITLFLLLGFIAFVGFDNLPAFRAGVMGIALIISKSLGRKVTLVNLLSLTVVVLLLINPLSLFSVSFQLSFAALLGVVGLSKAIEKRLGKFPKLLKTDFAATLAAITTTTPLTVGNFHTFSFIAPLVNLMVLPLIPLLMLLGLIELVASIVSIDIARLVALAIAPCFGIVVGIINFFGSLSISSVETNINQAWILLYVVVLLTWLFETSYRKTNAID